MHGIRSRAESRSAVTTPLPPDDAETRVSTARRGAAAARGPDDLEPQPVARLGWGMLLGDPRPVAVAAAIAAVYFATRGGDDSNAAQTTTSTRPRRRRRDLGRRPATAGKVFVPDVTGLKQDKAVARLGAAHLVPVIEFKPTKKPSGLVVCAGPEGGEDSVERGANVTLSSTGRAARSRFPT